MKKTTTFELLNQPIEIENLFGWGISMEALKINKAEGIYVMGHMKKCRKFTLDEAIEQVSTGNIAFCGIDGKGAHAAFAIKDPEIREYLFDTKEEPLQLTDERFKAMLELPTEEEVKKEMKKLIVTKSEAREARYRINTQEEYKPIVNKLPEWKRIVINGYCENILHK